MCCRLSSISKLSENGWICGWIGRWMDYYCYFENKLFYFQIVCMSVLFIDTCFDASILYDYLSMRLLFSAFLPLSLSLFSKPLSPHIAAFTLAALTDNHVNAEVKARTFIYNKLPWACKEKINSWNGKDKI